MKVNIYTVFGQTNIRRIMKKGIFIGVAIAVVVILVVFGWYFTLGLPAKLKNSKVQVVFTPDNTLQVDENATITVYVTNGEPNTITIDYFKFIASNENTDFSSLTTIGPDHPRWITGTIPAGQTVIVYKRTLPVYVYGDLVETYTTQVGNWSFEVICHTNLGELETTASFEVLLGSKVRAEAIPSTPRVNENATWTIYVTNGESGTMTINSFTVTAYKDNQLRGTFEVGPGDPNWVTGTVPTGETAAIYRTSSVSGWHDVGDWKWELTCHTNFGDLQTTFTFTVLERTLEWGEEGGEVLRSFDSPCNDLEGLAWDGSHIWCGDWDSHRIYKINPETGEVVASFDFPGGLEAGPGGLAWDGDYLWCGDRPADIIYKINPHTGAVIRTIDFPGYGGPAGLAWDGSYLWCGDANGNWIYKINPMTGELIKSFQVNYCYTRDLAWDGTYLWACGVEEAGNKNKIYKIDPDSGEVINYLCSPTPPTPGIEPAGLAWGGDSLWYAEKKDGTAIYREGGGRIYKLAVTP
jgi:hypothetical protein